MRARAARESAGREGVEAVDAARPDGELGAPAGRQPARVHEERVVEQRVERADREERRRQPGEIGVERRDVGIAAARAVGHEEVGEPLDDRRREHEVALAPAPLAGRHREVVGAVDEVRAGERPQPVAVAQAQQRQHREVRARRLAADPQACRSELGGGVAARARAPRLRSRRGRRGRGARARAGSRRSPPRGRSGARAPSCARPIASPRRASSRRRAGAGRRRARRPERARAGGARRPGPRMPRSRAAATVCDRAEDAAPLVARLADRRGRKRRHRRRRGDRGLELAVELGRLGVDRLGREELRIEGAGLGIWFF